LRSASPTRLMIFATSKGRIPVAKDFPPAPDWTTHSVVLSEFGLDGSDIQGILISGISGKFSFELDTVTLRR
jgi:hypothetical protein